MGYGKPLLFAGLGMIAGAASVAAMTTLLPAPAARPISPQSSLSPPALETVMIASPVLTGPRTAPRTIDPLPKPIMINHDMHPDEARVDLARLRSSDAVRTSTRREILTVQRGDTLMGVLVDAGVAREDAHGAVESLRTVYDPRGLRPGDEITVTFRVGAEDADLLNSFSLSPDPSRKVLTSRNNDGGFSTTEVKAKLTDETLRYEGAIESSLFVAATEAGVSAPALAEMIKVFSYDVDFQRDIHPGDSFKMMVARRITAKGERVGEPQLQLASMTLSGKRLTLYRFEDGDGNVDYYNDKGESVRKALLMTPINGARLSSGFGMRKHPILGYSKMHKGMDFAARTGTPVFAAGDGVVDMSRVNGGYGKYVRIRHNSSYSTAYAHLSGYGKGIKSGRRVKQGDIIGYVGTTGRSTGPHLHYEILKGGKQVNPKGVKFPTGRALAGKDLEKFQSVRAEIDREYAALKPATKVASTE